MDNANSKEYLEKIKKQVIENLKKTAHAPSVQMTEIPRTTLTGGTEEDEAEADDMDEDENPDVRMTKRNWDQTITRDDEFDESDDEEMARANGIYTNGHEKRRDIMDYQNPNGASDIEMESGIATPEVPNDVVEPATAVVTEANAQVNAGIMERKSRELSVAEGAEAATSNAPSPPQSVKEAVHTEVEMVEPPLQASEPAADASTTIQSPGTPLTPATKTIEEEAPALAPVVTEAEPKPVSPVDAAALKQEGEDERVSETITTEVASDTAQQAKSEL